MKAYIDLNQSKVLAYILPHDTADQTYERFVIAGGNKMWSRAWRLVNEAINVIKDDKEKFKW